MPQQRFTLVLETPNGTITAELEDAVYEAGCSDGALGERGGILYLEFDREAPSLLDAVLSAIRSMNSISDVTVTHVEPDELVTASDIAARLGRTRESVRLLLEGARGPGGFPVPVSGTSGRRTRFWRWSRVAEWLELHGFITGRQEEARVIAAVNGALDLSRNADGEAREEILAAVRNAA